MVLVDNDAFLTQLGKLMEANKQTGSIYISMKQVVRTEKSKTKNKTVEEQQCLVRVTDGRSGKKKKKNLYFDKIKRYHTFSTAIFHSFEGTYGWTTKAAKDKEKETQSIRISLFISSHIGFVVQLILGVKKH